MKRTTLDALLRGVTDVGQSPRRGSWLSHLPVDVRAELERFVKYLIEHEGLGATTARSYKSYTAKTLVTGKIANHNEQSAIEALRRFCSSRRS